MTFAELRKMVRKNGAKVYAIAGITQDSEIAVEVKKNDFLRAIDGWQGETNVTVTQGGKVIIFG